MSMKGEKMTILLTDVEAAEADLAVAKQAHYADRENADLRDTFKEAKKDVIAVRLAWRRQEELAGTRSGFVGGEATQEG